MHHYTAEPTPLVSNAQFKRFGEDPMRMVPQGTTGCTINVLLDNIRQGKEHNIRQGTHQASLNPLATHLRCDLGRREGLGSERILGNISLVIPIQFL